MLIVVINFDQSSYEVMENDTVTITIVSSTSSSTAFQVTIDTVDVNAHGIKLVGLLYLSCLSCSINSWRGFYC